MSYGRNGVRRKTKRRRYTDVEDKEVQYDEAWNACVEIRKDMKVITKRLKRCKPKHQGEPIRLGEVIEYAINTYHKNVSKLNNELRVEFQEVDDMKRDMNRMRQEHIDDITKHKNADKESKERLCSLEEEVNGERANLTQKINDLSKEKERLQQEIQDEKRQFHSTYDTFQQNIGKLQEEIDNLKGVVTQKDKELQKSQTEVHSLRDEIERRNENIHQLREELKEEKEVRNDEKKQKDKALSSLQDEIERRDKNLHHLRRELNEARKVRDDEKKQKDKALTRFSAIAADPLRNNNPGSLHLCDSNRPMKIAEKLTEMYDNDWTGAMEALKDLGMEEKDGVKMLLHFLTDSYEECWRRVTELDNSIRKAVLLSSADTQADESWDGRQDIPAEVTKPIKNLRRKLTANNVEVLQKILPQLLKDKRNITEEQFNGCEAFVEDCIKYAWLMQMHDPPVYIEWEFPEETKIDTNILRTYTKTGEKIDFIVWPVLYLHKDGPVLTKGVVQPIP